MNSKDDKHSRYTIIALLFLILIALACLVYVFLKTTPSKTATPTADSIEKVEFDTEENCSFIDELPNYMLCDVLDSEGTFKHIDLRYEGKVLVSNISKYSISHNGKWLIVVAIRESEASAPNEEVLYMISTGNGEITTLFSRIYFVNFYTNPVDGLTSWSPDGNGIAFTAMSPLNPTDISDDSLYSVIYCTKECKVLVDDAGPLGIGADAAYFQDGSIFYTDRNGKRKEIIDPIL